MNMRKTCVWTVLALALGLLGGRAWAADTASLTVTISPNAYYAVVIATTEASGALQLGKVDLAASTFTVKPATVTIESTYAKTELGLKGGIASAGTAWTFSANSLSIENDKLAAWAVFTDTIRSSAPAQTSGYFDGTTPGTASDMIAAGDRHVGDAGGGESAFLAGAADFGYKTMNDLPNKLVDLAASRAHLWLGFRLPGSSTSQNEQEVTVTLTAAAPQ